MVFSSITFLFIFLPLTIILYYILPKFLRNWFLLLISIIFYAWGAPEYLPIMLAIMLTNYIGALLINKFDKHSQFWLFITIAINITVLIYFKYFDFLIENFNHIFKSQIPLLNIALPLGISFYTFQAMSYTIDVFRKIVKPQKNFFKLALYISLFPQLIAGPIVKYHEIAEQIDNRKETFEQFYYGIRRFIIGLAKKVLLANTLGVIADKVFEQMVLNGVGVGIAWLGAFSRALQLYYDFSGYSDMAIGLGALFGFVFIENFNYPYISKTMNEGWRRWHISLGTWCKDYIYIPMGGNRVASWRIYFNLFFTFLIIGIWHGASWNFVVFGIWNGLFVILERFTGLAKKEIKGLWSIPLHLYIIFVWIINAILVNTDTFKHSILHVKAMFGIVKPEIVIYALPYYVETVEVITIIISVICCIPIFKNILYIKNTTAKFYINIWLLILLLLSVVKLIAETSNSFIYFRF